MIYTITLSPSIDYSLDVNNFEIGNINRSKNEKYIAGGKGINVSIVLNRLGLESKLLGFLGGFTGQFILEEINKQGLNQAFTHIVGTTRINVKINGLEESAINASSPIITYEEFHLFLEEIKKIKENDIVILSGSIPKSISFNMYEDMLKIIHNSNALFVLDTTGKYLEIGLKYKPFLIKPNKEELEDFFNVKLNSLEDIKDYAAILVNKGAKNVIVSLGKDGGILVNKEDFYKASAINGSVVSTVGAGDSLVAGFIYKFLETNDLEKALDFSCKIGSLTAFCEGLLTKEDLYKIK